MTARLGEPQYLEMLVARAADSDQGAFAELYDATAPRLFGLAMSLLHDPAEAMDVTTECYVEIWRSAADFDPGTRDALGWMIALLHTRAVTHLHRNGARCCPLEASAPGG